MIRHFAGRLPVLGVIPFQREPLGEDDDPAATEPFRVLHTNLNLALPAGKAQAGTSPRAPSTSTTQMRQAPEGSRPGM